MGSAAITFHGESLIKFLDEVMARFGDLRPLLERWGQYQVGVVKRRFQAAGPGWPPKNPYIAELERRTNGSGNVPGTFRGRLAGSITDDIVGAGGDKMLRVGSPLRYAATYQFGTPPGEPRVFYLQVIPDKDAEGNYERDEQGRVLGKIALRQSPNAVPQLMALNIKARPFLVEPDAAEEREMIDIAERYLLGGGNGGWAGRVA